MILIYIILFINDKKFVKSSSNVLYDTIVSLNSFINIGVILIFDAIFKKWSLEWIPPPIKSFNIYDGKSFSGFHQMFYTNIILIILMIS